MSAAEQISGYGLSATDEPVQLPARPEPLAMKASETVQCLKHFMVVDFVFLS